MSRANPGKGQSPLTQELVPEDYKNAKRPQEMACEVAREVAGRELHGNKKETLPSYESYQHKSEKEGIAEESKTINWASEER